MRPQGQLPLPSLSSSFLKVIEVDFELRLSSKNASGPLRTHTHTQIVWMPRYSLCLSPCGKGLGAVKCCKASECICVCVCCFPEQSTGV